MNSVRFDQRSVIGSPYPARMRSQATSRDSKCRSRISTAPARRHPWCEFVPWECPKRWPTLHISMHELCHDILFFSSVQGSVASMPDIGTPKTGARWAAPAAPASGAPRLSASSGGSNADAPSPRPSAAFKGPERFPQDPGAKPILTAGTPTPLPRVAGLLAVSRGEDVRGAKTSDDPKPQSSSRQEPAEGPLSDQDEESASPEKRVGGSP